MAMASLFRPFLFLSSFLILFPLTSPLSDSEALLNFKKSLTNAAALDSWVPGSSPCNNNWNGVLCSKQSVVDGSSEEATPNAPTDPHDHSRHLNESNKKIIAAFVTLGVMLLSVVLFFAIRWRRKKKQEDANALGRLNSAESAVEVQVSLPTRVPRPREMEAGRNKNNSSSNRSRGGSNNGRGHGNVPELVMVNDEKGVFGLPDLMKASAEVLGNGGLGSCYKATMANGATVVAKRMREMNALGKEPFDVEVKRIGKFKHPNVLTPLAYHYRKDEKLFVYEYLPKGNLLFLLHDVYIVTSSMDSDKNIYPISLGDHGTTSRGELDWPSRLKIVQGIAKGLDYIHTELASHDVPHGNLKSSNVLLGPDNHPFLLDYGFWPLLNPEGAKTLFAYKTPEAIQHGIVSHKSDIYCLGIIILEILTGKFPSQYLNDGNGGTDLVQWVAYGFSQGTQAEFLDPEIARRENSLGNIEKLLHIGLLCTQSDPEQRLDMKEALRMIEEVQVEGGLESQSQVRTIEVLPSLRDGYADGVPNINSQSTNSRDGNNGEQIHESEISEDRSGRPDGVP
ncbi:hypothetical protein COLO4_30789 [Corchorus olitorius]|uniref:Protein kinase domain-containing protein n=1 Tax=Corchorus olitorius TaxID=93759 RepID=A0A1R3H6U4_9ROSI|nr:hypothetical protein COLO4_30789 [Corchorus olitorius]